MTKTLAKKERLEAIEFREKPPSIIPPLATNLDAVTAWNMWCERFASLKQYPMDKDECMIFIDLSMSESQGEKDAPEELTKEFFYGLPAKRFAAWGVPITWQALAMIALVANNAAECVMFSHVLSWDYHKRQLKGITIDSIAHVFGAGFPSPEDRHDIWYEQKFELPKGVQSSGLTPDNFLDNLPQGCMGYLAKYLEMKAKEETKPA